jgi:hypothetical protein
MEKRLKIFTNAACLENQGISNCPLYLIFLYPIAVKNICSYPWKFCTLYRE